MKIRTLTLFPLVAIALARLIAAPISAGQSAHNNSDIPVDPAVTWGHLDNGIRYAVLPNAEPSGRVSVRLLVRAGSLNETDAQQGLALFIASMGFRGTRHFSQADLDKYLQDLGMKREPDSAVGVGFDLTVYRLELPQNDRDALAKAFKVLRDFADGIKFPSDPLALEIERSVFLEQRRRRDSVEYRADKDDWQFLMPGALAPHRFPDGQEKVLRAAAPSELADFYATWYRPERMAVIVVGQIRASEVAPLIVAAFGDLRDRAPARPEPDRGRIVTPRDITAHLHSDPEDHRVRVSIQTVEPYAWEPDTTANRLKYLPRELACAMLNRRLEKLSGKGEARSMLAFVSATEFLDFVRVSSIDIWIDNAEKWRPTLALAEQELRRALDHGFHPEELHDVVALSVQGRAEAAREASIRRSDRLADELGQAVAYDRVFAHPTVVRDMMKPVLEEVTVADCQTALRAMWSAPGRAIFVAGNLTLAKPEAEIVAAYNESRAVAVAAPPRIMVPAWSYTTFGAPGQIASRREVADLGITQVQYQNGVRVNLKRTDFATDRILVAARVGGGLLTLPKDKPGLQAFAFAAGNLMGLGRHSAEDVRRILLGRSVNAKLAVGNDAFVFSGSTTPEDLEVELQLLAAQISDPGYRPEVESQGRRSVWEAYMQMQHKPEGLRLLEIERALAGNDPRFGLPDQDTATRYTMNDLRAWLAPQLASGPIELTLVGDLDVEAAIAIAAKTFGALPPRAAKPAYEAERRVVMPASGFAQTRTVKTGITQGILFVCWPTADAQDAAQTRRLDVLAAIVENRLRAKIRAGAGEAFKPAASNAASDTFCGYGYLKVQIGVDPAGAPETLAAVRETTGDLQKNGVMPEEFEQAKQSLLALIAKSVRTNEYWLNAIGATQEFPQRIDWCRHPVADFSAITLEEVSALAARFLQRDREISYLVLPEPF